MHYLLRVLLMTLILFCIMEINCHSGVKLLYTLSLYSQNYAQFNHSDLTKWGFFSPNTGIQKQVVRGWRSCVRTWPPPDFLLATLIRWLSSAWLKRVVLPLDVPGRRAWWKALQDWGFFVFAFFRKWGSVGDSLPPGTPTTNSLARSVFHGSPLRAVEAGEGKCLFLSGHITTLKK